MVAVVTHGDRLIKKGFRRSVRLGKDNSILPSPAPFSQPLLYSHYTLLSSGYGFNPGSALLLTATSNTGGVAALAAVNTSLSAASGAVSALFTSLYLEERKTGEYSFNITMAMNGALAGLVGITAGCGTVENWAACCTGLVSGWVYIFGSAFLLRIKIDDAVDAIPVHMFCGAWGLIATGLFSSPRHTLEAFGTDAHVGWFYSLGQDSLDAILLMNQLLGLLFILGWSAILMSPFFWWLNYMGWLRADSLEELVGLDQAYHGGREAGEGFDDEVPFATSKDKPDTLRRRKGGNSAEGTRDDGSWTDLTASAPRETAPLPELYCENDASSKESDDDPSGMHHA